MTRSAPPLVVPGPWLLRPGGAGLAEHRRRYGAPPDLNVEELLALIEGAGVTGRGGAGFPFARKLRTTADRRALKRHVVVNVSEGEPASAKDAALATCAPHLVLDGAALTARALRARVVHLAVGPERPWVEAAFRTAIAERSANGVAREPRWVLHRTDARFVSGEASAVTEMIDGRENRPVTTWQPTAQHGVGGRPTMLSNAETFAQVAALVLRPDAVPGPATEPGTRLLSITRGDRIVVVEAPHGTPWTAVLTAEELARPVLLGGYHGSWAPAEALRPLTVSGRMREAGLPLGAGIVIPLPAGTCPVRMTETILHYLADQSAGRCGPCVNGLPALAAAFSAAAHGSEARAVERLAGLVEGRGACAHPDGTARLARSALLVFGDEIATHARGECSAARVNAGAR